MPIIRITGLKGEIRNYNLANEITSIGRDKNNEITLNDPRSSRRHAQIKRDKDGFVISDLGSNNGTMVNAQRIQSIRLKHKDEIKIGLSKLVFLEREEKDEIRSEESAAPRKGEYEDWQQKTISVSPDESSIAGLEAFSKLTGTQEKKKRFPFKKQEETAEPQSALDSLERANKALFVLYEISRHLNSMKSFDEILREMMNLLFKVIDADFGFLILTLDKNEENYEPLVVKYRDESKKKHKEIRASRTIIHRVIEDKVALLTSNALEDSRLGATESLVSQNIRSAMCVPLWKKEEIIGVIQLDSTRFDNQFDESDLELLKTIGCQMAMILEQASLNEKLRAEEEMRNKLERFHSPQVIEMILKSDPKAQEDIMEAKELDATVLFTDIVGFTPLSERMEPREVNALLNRHFSVMTDIIFEHDGTLDKYIGDGLMAVFGAPISRQDDAERAVSAALKMRAALDNAKKNNPREKDLNIRIGINTGKVMAGNIGSPKRMDYTVLGDAVNVASRLESIAESNQILIGQETCFRVKDKFKIQEVGLRKLKGKSQDLKIYEVLG